MVDTTGIYCRPSCPSRCNPANVTIHDTLERARGTGFRACKRCKPGGPAIDAANATKVTKACRLIERSFLRSVERIIAHDPSSFRKGGAMEEIRFAIGETTLGSILVASSCNGIAAILIGDDPDALAPDLQDRVPNAVLVGAHPAHEAIVATVVGFVEAPRIELDLPLDVRGTAFQQRVSQALRDIPSGRRCPIATSPSA